MLGRTLYLVLALLALATVALRVDAAEATITEFSAGLTPGSKPMGLAPGPDGNVWFTHYGDEGANPAVGRITTAGVITEFRKGLEGGWPQSIVAGPDGNMWFGITGSKTSSPAIGRITPEGEITRFAELAAKTSPDDLTVGPGGRIWWVSNSGSRPGLGYVKPSTGLVLEIFLPTWPTDIVAGPDGNMWFTYGEGATAAIARIDAPEDPGDTTITYFRDGLREESDPRDIVLGPDGNLWFTDPWVDAIGKVTPDGTITEFDAEVFTPVLSAGTDGNVWFADGGISRITPAGTITGFNTAGGGESRYPEDLTIGPDGNLWFAAARFEPGNGAVGRITPLGQVEEYNVGINPGSRPTEVVLGPDGNLWFADWGEPSAIGRVTPTGNGYKPPWEVEPEAPPTPGYTTPPFPAVPKVAPSGRRIAVGPTGKASVKLHCLGSLPCAGVLRLVVKKPDWAADRVIAAAPFSIVAGTAERVRLRIDRTGRSLLREAGGRRPARLTVLPRGPLLLSTYPVKLIARG